MPCSFLVAFSTRYLSVQTLFFLYRVVNLVVGSFKTVFSTILQILHSFIFFRKSHLLIYLDVRYLFSFFILFDVFPLFLISHFFASHFPLILLTTFSLTFLLFFKFSHVLLTYFYFLLSYISRSLIYLFFLTPFSHNHFLHLFLSFLFKLSYNLDCASRNFI